MKRLVIFGDKRDRETGKGKQAQKKKFILIKNSNFAVDIILENILFLYDVNLLSTHISTIFNSNKLLLNYSQKILLLRGKGLLL